MCTMALSNTPLAWMFIMNIQASGVFDSAMVHITWLWMKLVFTSKCGKMVLHQPHPSQQCQKGFSHLHDFTYHTTVADLGGVRGVQMHPPLAASNVFCVHNCTSPSNDYAAVACSNNIQAQLHTHISVPYWSPDVWLGLELLRDIQFGPRDPPRRASAYEISKSTGFDVDFGFQSGFVDFTVDFWISVWISADRFVVLVN